MKELYLESLRKIKENNIKNEKDYIELMHKHLILNIESLKYITQTRNFKKIVKLAEELVI